MPTSPPLRLATTSRHQRIGLLSTLPPKLCGLATFAAALAGELNRTGSDLDLVRIVDPHEPAEIGSVVSAELVNGTPASIRAAAAVLSRGDVAIIQHEYGIYGGADGDEVLELLGALDVPAIVILHTVPLVPTLHQRVVLEEVCHLADRVVVMTETACDRLTTSYAIDARKVVTIPHGATTAALDRRNGARANERLRPQLLTWGLLGPGKGIEHAIDALALLRDFRPRIRVHRRWCHPSEGACERRRPLSGVAQPTLVGSRGRRDRHLRRHLP